jgi:hypothetical protein
MRVLDFKELSERSRGIRDGGYPDIFYFTIASACFCWSLTISAVSTVADLFAAICIHKITLFFSNSYKKMFKLRRR